MNLQVRGDSLEAQRQEVGSGSAAVAGKHHRPPQSANKRKHRERFVEWVHQALDALPGPENLELGTVYVVDSPDTDKPSDTATVAVEASITIDCQGWIARQYEETLRAIGQELLRLADATQQSREGKQGPAEKQWAHSEPIVSITSATSVPMIVLEDTRTPGEVSWFAVDERHADALKREYSPAQYQTREIPAVFDGNGYAVAEIDWPAGFEPRHLLDQPAVFPRTEPNPLFSESFYRPGQYMTREEAMAEAAKWNRRNREDRFQWAVPVEVGQVFEERTVNLVELIGELGFLEHTVVSPVRVVKPTPAEVERFVMTTDEQAGKGGVA